MPPPPLLLCPELIQKLQSGFQCIYSWLHLCEILLTYHLALVFKGKVHKLFHNKLILFQLAIINRPRLKDINEPYLLDTGGVQEVLILMKCIS